MSAPRRVRFAAPKGAAKHSPVLIRLAPDSAMRVSMDTETPSYSYVLARYQGQLTTARAKRLAKAARKIGSQIKLYHDGEGYRFAIETDKPLSLSDDLPSKLAKAIGNVK